MKEWAENRHSGVCRQRILSPGAKEGDPHEPKTRTTSAGTAACAVLA